MLSLFAISPFLSGSYFCLCNAHWLVITTALAGSLILQSLPWHLPKNQRLLWVLRVSDIASDIGFNDWLISTIDWLVVCSLQIFQPSEYFIDNQSHQIWGWWRPEKFWIKQCASWTLTLGNFSNLALLREKCYCLAHFLALYLKHQRADAFSWSSYSILYSYGNMKLRKLSLLNLFGLRYL